ncbi:hypothetical protein N7461_006879 [Penicillium sp. DV-2018c]|nr:hypothetical protein N7461_006879 [Penicillium sp. DV-2018c]
MLLAMYFNGYIIICIFIGVFLGALVFSWEPLNFNEDSMFLLDRMMPCPLRNAAVSRTGREVLGSASACGLGFER